MNAEDGNRWTATGGTGCAIRAPSNIKGCCACIAARYVFALYSLAAGAAFCAFVQGVKDDAQEISGVKDSVEQRSDRQHPG